MENINVMFFTIGTHYSMVVTASIMVDEVNEDKLLPDYAKVWAGKDHASST